MRADCRDISSEQRALSSTTLWGASMLDPELAKVAKTLGPMSFPTRFAVEVCADCNLKCSMCHHPFMRRPKGKMPFELWKKVRRRDRGGCSQDPVLVLVLRRAVARTRTAPAYDRLWQVRRPAVDEHQHERHATRPRARRSDSGFRCRPGGLRDRWLQSRDVREAPRRRRSGHAVRERRALPGRSSGPRQWSRRCRFSSSRWKRTSTSARNSLPTGWRGARP